MSLRLKGAKVPISPFTAAINQICDEKGLKETEVISAVEQAVAAAYRKDYGHPKEMIRARYDASTSQFKIYQEFEVTSQKELQKQAKAEAREQKETGILAADQSSGRPTAEEIKLDPHTQLTLKEAQKINSQAKLGEKVRKNLPYRADFGRIAAMTAKQVIVQRLRESERNMLFNEYKKKEGEVISAVVQQIEGQNIIVNIGKTNGLLPLPEQISREHYYIGQRLRIFIKEVDESPRGPKIIVSRSHPGLLDGLFRLEVPEVNSGAVEIKAIAREPGSRSKVAISTQDKQLDPVGTCVGQRGARIQAILAEIGDEKVDIILWDKDPKKFLVNALAPAEVEKITLSKDKKNAKVKVADDQLSLAIGKSGQNVRLAGKLTNIEVDIIKPPLVETDKAEIKKKETETSDKLNKKTQKPKKATPKTEKPVRKTKTSTRKTTKK